MEIHCNMAGKGYLSECIKCVLMYIVCLIWKQQAGTPIIYFSLTQVLSTYNCKESSYRYTLNINDKIILSNSTSTSRTIFRDGNVGVSAEVWLIQRNGDLSESVKKSIVTKQGLRMFAFLYYLITFSLLFAITTIYMLL